MPSSDHASGFRQRAVLLLGLCVAAICGLPGALGVTSLALGSPTKQGKKVGNVTEILEDTVLLRGKLLTHGQVPLYAKDVLNTKGGGSVVFKLKQRHTTCTLYSGSVLTVKPKKLAITRMPVGKYWCMARAASDNAAYEAGDDKVKAKDPVFGVQVNRRHKVVVKVDRGLVIVSGSGGPARAVIVGRKQQVVVPAGRDPRPPTPVQLTPRDRAAIKKLSPVPVADTTAPTVRITRSPKRITTSREATFAFRANEKNVVFSCSLDAARFHPCSSPKTYPALKPDRHAFAVRATDLAGNTSKAAPFAWSIRGNGPTAIAFSSDRSGNFEIYTIDPSGRGLTRLTTNRAPDLDPAWSPQGTKLAFHSDRGGNRQIYVMNADGSGQTRLTTNQASEFNPAWSPDGRKLAFHSNREDQNYEIYVMNPDGSGQTRVTKNLTGDFNPTWSPDGRMIAFQSDRDGNSEIYVMNAGGSGQTRVTNDPAEDLVPDW